ncbi:hypothetical protein EHQ23_07355 [Leptospira bourretii]|uniref:Lipoprotein n=1 Tax=Leptospira bourretii TaxID=2484962 RepID=A0A4V3JKS4_9LEPT|nr:hypothetical protein [Leptospira bourretii]TGK87205.1 hypothetical protein EHQ23_07355 [Leptospira bourretii]TGK87661.1 hypothetical protein EHQ26_19460 [Leptospira bourretii]TGL43925.1 hypothetical protein EHQ45_00025 [Leptospira bourretii]
MRLLLTIAGLFVFLYCKSARENVNLGINPEQGKQKILLGDFRQKTNVHSMNLGKLAKDIAVIELMKEGYHVEIFETSFDPILVKREEPKSTLKNMILKAAGEQNERIITTEMFDSHFISELGKEKSFDYFIQGKLHIYKEEFKQNAPTEIIAYITLSNSEGKLIAAISSKAKTSAELNSEDISEVILNGIKKIPQVINK